MIRFQTTHGDFSVELLDKEAPISVENFLKYVDDGHFDGTIFHRIVPGFVIERGTLSMARTNDVNSATSQFFVNLSDNAFLDNTKGLHGYAVFGRVHEGMDVVDKIAKVRTGTRKQYQDAPLEDAVIIAVRRVEPA